MVRYLRVVFFKQVQTYSLRHGGNIQRIESQTKNFVGIHARMYLLPFDSASSKHFKQRKFIPIDRDTSLTPQR
nr:unnamed protein product [Haemonchus contortus]